MATLTQTFPVNGLKLADGYGVTYVETDTDTYFEAEAQGQPLQSVTGEILTFPSFEAAAEALRGYVAWNQL